MLFNGRQPTTEKLISGNQKLRPLNPPWVKEEVLQLTAHRGKQVIIFYCY